MEDSWENWDLPMEIDPDEDFLLDKCHTEDDDEFLREILLQHPTFSSESETDQYSVQNNGITTVAGAAAYGGVILSSDQEMGGGGNNMVKSNTSNGGSNSKRPRHSSSTPRTYILSFDDSTMIPVTPEAKHSNSEKLLLGGEGTVSSNNSNSPSIKKSLGSQNSTEAIRPNGNNQGGGKKARSSSQSMDHIMAERKRRQELTERFIALSATIPGLNKTDKASILRAAIDYVKQLQERVQELEKEDKNNRGSTAAAESVIFITRSDICGNIEESTTSSETSSDDCCTLPEIEARVLGKEVLIEIHCEKENGIELKILDHLENLQLCVTGSSVLPFGNSTLGITIVAQMCNAFTMTVNDLVKNLRQVLLKSDVHGSVYNPQASKLRIDPFIVLAIDILFF